MSKAVKQLIHNGSATVLTPAQLKKRRSKIPAVWEAVRGLWANRVDLKDPVAVQRRMRQEDSKHRDGLIQQAR